jgi:hypothetical protein
VPGHTGDPSLITRSSPRRSRRMRRIGPVLLGALLSLLVTAGCGGGDGPAGGKAVDEHRSSAKPASRPGGLVRLAGVCPERVTVMTPWFPEAEIGALYQLLGPGYTIDAARKRVSGRLVARGTDTGVRLELRAGGPAVGFGQVSTQMYLDTNITLGMPPLDELAQLSAKQPTVAVLAPLERDPLAVGWDPRRHPELATIRDIGRTDTKVLAYTPDTAMDYLVGSGVLKRSQVDGSYDGSPARFVAARGQLATVLFATNEPYTYEKEVTAWGRPLRFQLVNDAGYPNYRNVVTVRAADKAKLAPCLRRLVPIIQRAQVDFLAAPDRTIDLILDLNKAYRSGFVYSRGNAEFAVRQMKALNIVGNGSDQTLGNFDERRVRRLTDVTRPVFAAQRTATKKDLKPEDLVTNEFIDPTIGLGPDERVRPLPRAAPGRSATAG